MIAGGRGGRRKGEKKGREGQREREDMGGGETNNIF